MSKDKAPLPSVGTTLFYLDSTYLTNGVRRGIVRAYRTGGSEPLIQFQYAYEMVPLSACSDDYRIVRRALIAKLESNCKFYQARLVESSMAKVNATYSEHFTENKPILNYQI